MQRHVTIFAGILVATSSASASAGGANVSVEAQSYFGECPPANFAAQHGFDLGDFVHREWYVQQRMRGNSNTPRLSNMCIAMYYNMMAQRSFWGYDISIRTFSRDDRFPHAGTFHDDLCARIEDRYTGKFKMARCSTPSLFARSYWVVAHDTSAGYAIISRGTPDSVSSGGCTASGGLWIMTRQQRRNDGVLDQARSRARELGFDLSVLEDIYQDRCTNGGDIPDDFHV
mmetsp:Transcript_80464/g.225798  ORF Transcript_80464/g.225798 Transcript_80464/m.225798 type:complete len:229 (+) Transcript_80464:56-742(+)|eukprot:CAMPEP_0176287562 /NCGR_PEP_ID=MMETSP0121_2-20121125/53503_1 /TAXON_ID=160619 /ORGANISM="Kryptoperidinium foliaceum, Strain CCMP 1326" /LENGTH=228 /DNA_ID=CAMNT_0017628189 /DNA_START=56 /DNA_END=742 /DNA_ORIENTATION=-